MSASQTLTGEEDKLTNLGTVAKLPASSADRARSPLAEPEKNGVHIRGLLLHARAAAHGGAYLLRYLACKYTFRQLEMRLLACHSNGANRSR